ncbi:cytochrome c oxidase subunit II [Natronorubrum sp. FCH18a]|uniref:cytochrome c oxidase subunit II n=1 Tax=Natronorubrum sp. FCH18a TaxID=3447018 RepID=UPI003F519F18
MQVQTRVDVFESIFQVFLALGTLVGVVVIAYTLYNAYKYRDSDDAKADDSLPTLGELPTGGEGGKKLFLSFGISAIIVISLVIWTYGMLLYVEDPQEDFEEEPVDIEVVGNGFAWSFEYENGAVERGTMTVPEDHPVAIQVTSGDVWHSFGVPDLRVKADAIPGEYDETWFIADDADAEHRIQCFELCGDQHTQMDGTVQVLPEDEFEGWLDERLNVEIEFEDPDGEPINETGELELELELVHVDNDEYEEDLEYSYTDEDFENNTISIEDIEQGGDYNLTIEFENEEFETVEDEISVTSPTSETYTLGESDEEETEEDENDDDEEANDSDDGGEN